jgi:hypothetical protein
MPIVQDAFGVLKRTDGRALYKCDCCERVDAWDDGWAWFGSYRQLEDFGMKDVKPVMTICSPTCRVTLVAQGRLPSEGIDDNGNVVEEKDQGAPFRKRRVPSRASSLSGDERG